MRRLSVRNALIQIVASGRPLGNFRKVSRRHTSLDLGPWQPTRRSPEVRPQELVARPVMRPGVDVSLPEHASGFLNRVRQFDSCRGIKDRC
jgi:hypothetical protein